MSCYLFVNPASGHHSAGRLESSLERLHAHAIIPEIFQVRSPAEIFACCTRINSDDAPPTVIVAGGDGTFNAVVNGLTPGSATMAILPFGTSNVLAAELGIASLDDALERIIGGKTASLSVGVLELAGRSLRFVLMAGIGFDGAVVRDVWPRGKKLLRQGAYVISAVKNLIGWNPATFTLATPNGDITCHTTVICNASRYGGCLVVSPGSTPLTPGLTAVCMTGNTRSSCLHATMELFQGSSGTAVGLLRKQATFFEISGTHPIQIDGDFIGYGPAHISVCPDFAKMIV
jgi:diacylglycerol kinase family enzyme